jgi:hypothetical protein
LELHQCVLHPGRHVLLLLLLLLLHLALIGAGLA